MRILSYFQMKFIIIHSLLLCSSLSKPLFMPVVKTSLDSAGSYAEEKIAQMESNCNSNKNEPDCRNGAPYCEWSDNDNECKLDQIGNATKERMKSRCDQANTNTSDTCLKVGIFCEFDGGRCQEDRFYLRPKKKASRICELLGVPENDSTFQKCVDAHLEYCTFRNGTRDC
jgi:hypothetical protein